MITQVLQGWAGNDEYQAAVTQLELLLSRWLYQNWSENHNTYSHNELAYLAYVGSGIIIDTLVAEGQISLRMAGDVTSMLLEDTRFQPVKLHEEQQPLGFFRPVLGNSLNYAASYLLHGLLSDEAYLPEYKKKTSVKNVLLQFGATNKVQQALFESDQWTPSWLDSELATDIGGACVDILGYLSESDTEEWSDLDRYRIEVAASNDVAGFLAQHMARAIGQQESETEVLASVTMLFQGRMYPTLIWYETLSILFESEVLERICRFAQSYGEVVANFTLMLIKHDANFPPKLSKNIHDFLLEVPTGEDVAELIKVKAYVFSQLLLLGLDIALVCKWIKNVAMDRHLDVPISRLAFRPFILFWRDFESEIRKPLFDSLMEIATMPDYKGLWEFTRLARDKEILDNGSQL